MTTTATRLITLILLLQNRPNRKAAALAQELGVSVRTLHRYFGMLDEMGIPVYSERGPYGGFSLVRGYKMPPLVFSPPEAVAVTLGTSLVEEMWGSLYQDAARSALAKLENLLPEEQRHEVAWAQRSLIATGLHRADPENLAPHLEKMRYRSSNNPHPQVRQFDAYALVHRWGWWYTIGYCHLRQAIRSFRVDRIETLALHEETYEIPPEFDVHAYLAAEFQDQPQIEVRLRFGPQAAQIALANRSNWERLEQLPDGAIIASFSAPDLPWAASSVLIYGPAVEVLDPPKLRQLVQEWAQAINQLYETR
jgi:predicted DNA-binding transcriptional regulator YafY